LRAEEFPSGLVCAKLLLLFSSELGALALFVRVDAGLFCATGSESLETCGVHQTHFSELADAFDVNSAPGAGGPARSEANRVAGFVETLSNAVDPSEAESGVYGFRPGNAGFPGTFFVEADKEFVEFVVITSSHARKSDGVGKKVGFGGMASNQIKSTNRHTED